MHPLPKMPLAKILACHSKSSEFSQLQIFVYELPQEGCPLQRTKGNRFVDRPTPERGEYRVTVPQFGLSQHRTSSDQCLPDPGR